MSHKNFQHFINWFDIIIRAKTNIKKKKGKIKQKIKGKAYLAPRAKPAHPAQPAHRGSGVFFPLPRTQAARWNATEPAGGDTPPPTPVQASPCLLLAPGDALEHASSIPPLQSSSPFSPARIRRRPKLHRSAPPWTTWPPCTRAQASKSIVLLALDFVIKQKLEP